ncbi:MAG: carbon-nitrogen hydrolase family protein [bacterium]
MKTRIALCQLNPLSRNPKNNLTIIEQVIDKYSKKGVKLFIFPEDFLFGILRKKSDSLIAGKEFHYYLDKFSKFSKEYKVDIIPGSFPMLKNNKLYNTTVYIDKNGEVLNQYSKTNLWLSERDCFTTGKGNSECFKSVLGKTVQIICWDLMDHKLFEDAVRQKAEWIIVTSFWTVNRSSDLVKKRGETKNSYFIPINRSERLSSLMETRSQNITLE